MHDDDIAIFVEYAEQSHRDGTFSLSISDLTFYYAEVAYLAGANGSGKSTLMRILALEDEPASGNIWIAGRQITKLSGKDKSNLMGGGITYIPQAGMGLNKKSPMENITRILQDFDNLDKREAERRARAALSQVGLKEELYFRSVKQLSGGQKARVAVAKAIAAERPIILADEIFKEIDGASVLNIIRLFQNLAKQGYAIVVIGHLPDSHKEYFHRVVTLSGGRVVGNEPQTPEPVPAPAGDTEPLPDRVPRRHRHAGVLPRLLAAAALAAMFLMILFVWPQPESLFAGHRSPPRIPFPGTAPPTARPSRPTMVPTTVLSSQSTQIPAIAASTVSPTTAVPSTSVATAPTTTGTVPPSASVVVFVGTAPPPPQSIPTAGGQPPSVGESIPIVPGGPPTTGSEPVEITRDPAAWSGGYYRGDSNWCGRPWVAVYGAQSAASQATLDIPLDAAGGGGAQLLLTGMDDELPQPTRIEITVNGQTIFSGPSPFLNWDGLDDCAHPTWTTVTLAIPAGLLHAGDNQITIANLEPSGAIGLPPYVMLSTAILRLSD